MSRSSERVNRGVGQPVHAQGTDEHQPGQGRRRRQLAITSPEPSDVDQPLAQHVELVGDDGLDDRIPCQHAVRRKHGVAVRDEVVDMRIKASGDLLDEETRWVQLGYRQEPSPC